MPTGGTFHEHSLQHPQSLTVPLRWLFFNPLRRGGRCGSWLASVRFVFRCLRLDVLLGSGAVDPVCSRLLPQCVSFPRGYAGTFG
eukprot:5442472-Alexandrium_andersonii.AAC.1